MTSSPARRLIPQPVLCLELRAGDVAIPFGPREAGRSDGAHELYPKVTRGADRQHLDVLDIEPANSPMRTFS
jgi:hypothetical protein